MDDNNNFNEITDCINYLNFIYKYKRYMDTVCSEVVTKLNNKKKKSLFKLNKTPMNYSVTDDRTKREIETEFFCGYYIQYNNKDDIYIGLNWEDIKKDPEDPSFYFSVDIWKKDCKDCMHYDTDCEHYTDCKCDKDWVYFKILTAEEDIYKIFKVFKEKDERKENEEETELNNFINIVYKIIEGHHIAF